MAAQLLTPKEIATAFEQRGVRISVRYARALVRVCPLSIRRRYCSAEDAWQWWAMNPDWRPRGRDTGQQTLPVAPAELSASATRR